MKPHWILVANATEARLFQQEPGSPLVVLHAFHRPEGRLRTAQLGDDKAGREASGQSFGGAAYQPRADAHRKQHLHFAHDLADHLEQAAREHAYASVAVYASSPFLGELRQLFGDATRKLLAGTHDVDLTSFDVAEIERRVQDERSRAH